MWLSALLLTGAPARADEPEVVVLPDRAEPGPPEPIVPDPFVGPVPLDPLVFPWPADEPAAAPVTVRLLLAVGADGRVGDVAVQAVEGAADPAAWAARAVALARQLRFAPARASGQAVAVDLPLTVPFVAAEPAGEAAAAPEVGLVGAYVPERAEPDARVLTAAEVRTTPGTLGDPLRAVTNLPGAVRTPLDAGYLIVRGGEPRDTGVYVDGVDVPLIYHLGGFTSVLHPAFIDRLAFLPGGRSARYGRATAGVVDLQTAAAAADRVAARVGANLVLAGGYVALPLRGATVEAAFRRSYLDAVLNAVPGVTAEQAAIAPRFYDYQLRARLNPPGAAPVQALGFGFVDTLDGSTSSGERVEVRAMAQQVQGDGRATLGGKALIVRPFARYERRDVTLTAADRQQVRRTVGGGARVELADDGADAWGWSAGLDARTDAVDLAYNGIPRGGWLSSPDAYADLRVGGAARAVLGLRADTALVSGQDARVAASPRLSGVLPLDDAWTLRADAGVYHQAPPADLLIGPPEGASLRLERSVGGGLGARWSRGPWSIDVGGYARRVAHRTAYEADGSLGQGDGLDLGVESQTRFAAGGFSGWATVSWTRALARDDAGKAWVPTTYDQPLSVVLVGAESLGRGWTLSGRFRYTSGVPAPSEPDAVAFDVLRGVTVPLDGGSDGRLPAFHALDVKVARTVTLRAASLDLYLDVQNVYNRRVAEPVITGIGDVYPAQAWGVGLPVLPILGIEGRVP